MIEEMNNNNNNTREAAQVVVIVAFLIGGIFIQAALGNEWFLWLGGAISGVVVAFVVTNQHFPPAVRRWVGDG